MQREEGVPSFWSRPVPRAHSRAADQRLRLRPADSAEPISVASARPASRHRAPEPPSHRRARSGDERLLTAARRAHHVVAHMSEGDANVATRYTKIAAIAAANGLLSPAPSSAAGPRPRGRRHQSIGRHRPPSPDRPRCSVDTLRIMHEQLSRHASRITSRRRRAGSIARIMRSSDKSFVLDIEIATSLASTGSR